MSTLSRAGGADGRADRWRWCEYIAFRGLWRIAFARVTESDISDTELQVGKFMLPKPGETVQYDSNEELYWHIGEDDVSDGTSNVLRSRMLMADPRAVADAEGVLGRRAQRTSIQNMEGSAVLSAASAERPAEVRRGVVYRAVDRCVHTVMQRHYHYVTVSMLPYAWEGLPACHLHVTPNGSRTT